MNFTHTGRLKLSEEAIETIRNCGDVYSEVVISMNGEVVKLFITIDDNNEEIVHFRTHCGHDSILGIAYFEDIRPILNYYI